MALAILAESSQDGRHGAYNIIAKLVKKQADGEHVANPSRFVQTCVAREHDNFQPWAAQTWA